MCADGLIEQYGRIVAKASPIDDGGSVIQLFVPAYLTSTRRFDILDALRSRSVRSEPQVVFGRRLDQACA